MELFSSKRDAKEYSLKHKSWHAFSFISNYLIHGVAESNSGIETKLLVDLRRVQSALSIHEIQVWKFSGFTKDFL